VTGHADILIATPGHSLMGAYVMSLLATTNELDRRGISWAWLNRYASHVADAREITLANSLHNNVGETRPLYGAMTYKKIVWIDSDIAWTPDDFMRLYESDLDIVSGAYLLASGEVTAYPERLGPGYTYEQVKAMTEPVKVHGVGFGFLAVKQGIFEQLSRPWFQSVEVTMTDSETGSEWTFPIMGEDISWCERVGRLGYDIWLDPTVRVTHHKMMTLSWEGIRP
jgi:GT2 family glycosyltransferase